MLAGVCFGTNDLAAAGQFYDQVLATIGWSRQMQNDVEIGYSRESTPAEFWVLTPFDQRSATRGNGTQVMFMADNISQVDAFHAAVIRLGGADEGKPGPRDYRAGYYGAYCRDLDGNKLHVFTIQEES